MDNKTRNIVVGISYASIIIFSYIGLILYNAQYQAIDNSYILIFCLFEALFLRMAIGPIIIPINPKPKANVVSTIKKLSALQQKNTICQTDNKKIHPDPLIKNVSGNTSSMPNGNNKSLDYLMDQNKSSSSLSADTKTQTLTSKEEPRENILICVQCQAQIPDNTNNLIHCPFCNTLLTKPDKTLLKKYYIQEEKLFKKSLGQNSSRTLPKQTTTEILSNKRQNTSNIPLINTTGTRNINNTGHKDNYIGRVKEQSFSLEIGKTEVEPNKNADSLEDGLNTKTKNVSLTLETSPNDKLVFDRLNLVTERLEQKRQEIEQKWRKNNNKVTLNYSKTLREASLEQDNDTILNIQCTICNKFLQLHITRQNTTSIITLNNKQIPLYHIPNGYSLIFEHVDKQPEEVHQLFLTLNKHLEILSQEVTIILSKIQSTQKIDEEKSTNLIDPFLTALKYPCRLCKQEFSIGDHYIKTKYESTNHTEIIHVRTSHQTIKQTENHEALIKIDLTQKTLLNMPEINVISSKQEQHDDNSVILTT